ncbi:serine/threonine protein kinase [Anabaena azotica]|uniref:Serine/threonine protein kinase n=1 Tax=Anabaena azotica FACHB-119 TaxID=947527 RepID=A0ABR8DEJ6_9NOST|nr:serine/threonine-protein kinase [Anabaena azotica]MBD2504622.1 serine/threonine protein kinase [Anabaena azotica FACHB-119]
MLGEIFNTRYEILQLLGKKAGRRTVLAKDVNTGKLVIVKLVAFGSDFEWDDLKLFEREAETLKSLSHPSIPRYLDYFDLNSPTLKGFALVQSYISAQTLEQHLQAGRIFTESDVKQIATAILEILIYLHGLYPPVIHRDIKPSNILLGERSGNSVGQVYLVDFGSVQTALGKEEGTRTVVGTYGYMPPEQFGGRTIPASDLYSLGATLIYLLTGTHPADLPQKDFRIQFEQLVNISPGLTSWLKSITEPSSEKRFSSAQEALKALHKPQLHDVGKLAVSKPLGSKIKLSKDRHSLEIVIPPEGANLLSVLFLVAFIILWSCLPVLLTIAAILSFNTSLFVSNLPFLYASYFLCDKLLFEFFRNIKLRLDNEQITCTKELFGFKSHLTKPSPRESISKLIYIPKHFAKDSDGDKIQVPAQLEIWAGAKKYELGDNTKIKSETELEWLAYELSDWLNIPIERVGSRE